MRVVVKKVRREVVGMATREMVEVPAVATAAAAAAAVVEVAAAEGSWGVALVAAATHASQKQTTGVSPSMKQSRARDSLWRADKRSRR